MSQLEMAVQSTLKGWSAQVAATDKLLAVLSDEQLLKQIAPGKNRGIYLLGHLVAVNDDMLKFLNAGERAYTHLDEAFINNPDNADAAMPELSVLRSDWKKSCETLAAYFAKTGTDDWFTRHSAVSAEAFVNEPHRNKLAIIISRTGHLAYHLGQMALLK